MAQGESIVLSFASVDRFTMVYVTEQCNAFDSAVNFYKSLTEFYLTETLLPSLFLIASLSESI